jgi:hypothetical protein
MDSSTDGGFCFLHSWSDDLDPAARRSCPPGGAFVNLEGVYLPPDGDAPALTARSGSGGARSLVLASLSVAAAWLLMRAP